MSVLVNWTNVGHIPAPNTRAGKDSCLYTFAEEPATGRDGDIVVGEEERKKDGEMRETEMGDYTMRMWKKTQKP